jgi:hypothetical protein
MPWSVWIVAAMILVTFNDLGAILTIMLTAPFWLMYFEIAKSFGIKTDSLWPLGIAVAGLGILLAARALKRPQNPFYKHAAILILGFLVAATISLRIRPAP